VARSSSTRALINAAIAGAGIALLPYVLVRAIPALVEIPAPLPIPPRPAWLVTHRDLRRARPLRIVRDWIIAAFRVAHLAEVRPGGEAASPANRTGSLARR